MRQLIKYPGSKWSLSNWVTSFFPQHHSYVEPFFGSGAVLFNKKPSNIETVNDIDGEVVNLFECIKQDPEKLAKIIYLTPYSRDVFEDAYQIRTRDKYEKASAFMVRCDMGHGFRTTGEKVGFKMDVQGRESAYAVKHWNQVPNLIMECASRLKEVQIENRDAVNVIERFNHSNVLIYLDPPYMLETRHGKQYRHEMNNADHKNLLDVIVNHKAKIIISGYPSKFYDNALKGWHKETHISRNQRNKQVKEVIWMNFEPSKQLELK